MVENAKVDTKLQHISKTKSWIKSCIGCKYVRVYEVECQIVAMMGWYLYFLPDILETTSGLETGGETLRNLLYSFHSSWCMTRSVGEHTDMTYVHEVN